MSGEGFLHKLTYDEITEKELQISKNCTAIYKLYKTHPGHALELFNKCLIDDDTMTNELLNYCRNRDISLNLLKKQPIQMIRFIHYYKYATELIRFHSSSA